MIHPKIAAIQMCSSHDVKENLTVAAKLIHQAAQQGAKLVVLPENFALMGLKETDKIDIKESWGHGPIQLFLSEQAQKNRVWIVGGTIPIAAENPQKVHAACLVYNDQGKNVARYDKIHLFDVVLSEKESYCESATIEAGNKIVLVETPFGKLGLAVCYDLRFPGLFTYLYNCGAEIIAVPSAFTLKTGSAHWHLLTRCRAIDTFCYVIAAAQGGSHSNGRATFGHSVIVDPWGIAIQECNEGIGVIAADIDLEYLYKVRRSIPTLQHQKIPPDVAAMNNS